MPLATFSFGGSIGNVDRTNSFESAGAKNRTPSPTIYRDKKSSDSILVPDGQSGGMVTGLKSSHTSSISSHPFVSSGISEQRPAPKIVRIQSNSSNSGGTEGDRGSQTSSTSTLKENIWHFSFL
jgi:hypothetical protein